MAEVFKRKKKVCQLCLGKTLDYKDVEIIKKYINDKKKILPRRATGACAKHQRYIRMQVQRARYMAFISFTR